MKKSIQSKLIALYEYGMADGLLYSRAFPGSGYGQFLKKLQQKLADGEITLEEAYDCVDTFKPSVSLSNHESIDGDVR
jgi:hypothetical protein